MEIRKQESLKNWTWWKVGGIADYFCQPENPEQLKSALQWAEKENQKVTVLGGGTNVLISDQGVEGLVISTIHLNHFIVQKNKNTLSIRCGAGVLKSQVMKAFKTYKLAPALFLSGIPGNVGGGIVMNAGVSSSLHPSEFSEILKSFKVMSAKGTQTYSKKDINWSYRKGFSQSEGLIYEADLEWPLEELEDFHTKMKKELQKRRLSQPLSQASCGSVFKNPYPQFSGKLIEKSGLKGLKKGSAQVSEKHANFIINEGSAKAQDIHDLIKEVQKKVYSHHGVHLEPEVHYLGRWSKF